MKNTDNSEVICRGLGDPTYEVLPVRRAMISYVRAAQTLLIDWLDFADAWFAKTVGFLLIIKQLYLWGSSQFGWTAELGGRSLAAVTFSEISDPLAVAIVLVWLSSKVVHRHRAYQATAAVAVIAKSLFHAVATYSDKKLNRRPYSVCAMVPFSTIPERHKQQILTNIATLAYNRWTSNASLHARIRFFSNLAVRFPTGLRVGLELDANREISTYAYCAYVPMSIPNYLQHRNAQINLYDQVESFILSQEELESRIRAYQTSRNLDKNIFGIAVYVLGMNVIGGLEASRGPLVMRTLRREMQTFLARFPHQKPEIYCVTTIPSVMRSITESGFVISDKSDIHGNRFWDLRTAPSVDEGLDVADTSSDTANRPMGPN